VSWRILFRNLADHYLGLLAFILTFVGLVRFIKLAVSCFLTFLIVLIIVIREIGTVTV
jgi:hypothetical protein